MPPTTHAACRTLPSTRWPYRPIVTVHAERPGLATGTPERLYLPHHRWQAHRGLEEVMIRAARRTLLSAGLAGVVTAVTLAVTVAPSWATPPSGLTNIPLARGTDTSHGTIPLRFGTDVAMAQITVDPGGSSSWHSHPGGRDHHRQGGRAHRLLTGRPQVPDHHVQRGAGVHRATWRSG